MNVFIGWSNCREIAARMNEFLGKFFRGHVHFDFSEDIPQGSVWHSRLTDCLKSADFGILCITPKSHVSWLCYEAGALSQRVHEELLILPLLFGMDTASFRKAFDPLSHYQHAVFSQDSMIKLLNAINNASRNLQEEEEVRTGSPSLTSKYLEDHEFEKRFKLFYPDFETDIRRLMKADELEVHLAAPEKEGVLPPAVGMSGPVLYERGKELLQALRSGTSEERTQSLEAFTKHLEYMVTRLEQEGIYLPVELKDLRTDALQLAALV